jgi:hypothetical protein
MCEPPTGNAGLRLGCTHAIDRRSRTGCCLCRHHLSVQDTTRHAESAFNVDSSDCLLTISGLYVVASEVSMWLNSSTAHSDRVSLWIDVVMATALPNGQVESPSPAPSASTWPMASFLAWRCSSAAQVLPVIVDVSRCVRVCGHRMKRETETVRLTLSSSQECRARSACRGRSCGTHPSILARSGRTPASGIAGCGCFAHSATLPSVSGSVHIHFRAPCVSTAVSLASVQCCSDMYPTPLAWILVSQICA